MPKFLRLSGPGPTRHLFVGGFTIGKPPDSTSSGLVTPEEICAAKASYLARLLEPFGRCSVHAPSNPKKRGMHVSFDDVDAAVRARDALDGTPHPALAAPTLFVCFCSRRDPPAVPDWQPAHTIGEALAIPGLSLHMNFLSENAEEALVRECDAHPWVEMAKRRVQHHGYRFDYVRRQLDLDAEAGPFPEAIRSVVDAVQGMPQITHALDQLTVNEYPAGVGLAPHIDSHTSFDDCIAILSLLSGVVMQFRNGGAEEGIHAAPLQALYLPPRSLLLLTGEARYAWQHYIPHRKSDVLWDEDGDRVLVPRGPRRVSYTFRRARHGPCACRYPECCDSQAQKLPPTRLELLSRGIDPEAAYSAIREGRWPEGVVPAGPALQRDAEGRLVSRAGLASRGGVACGSGPPDCDAAADLAGEGRAPPGESRVAAGDEAAEALGADLERAHVHDVYDAIAPHFSSTRFSVWPKVREFLMSLAPSSLLADVGCGNGKYFGVRDDLVVVGTDMSVPLCELASARSETPDGASGKRPRLAGVVAADSLCLPLASGSVDAVICIAVLHHMSTVERRVAVLREIRRVLLSRGRALVTVWATRQENMDKVMKWERIGASAAATARGDDTADEYVRGGGHGIDCMVPWNVPGHWAASPGAAAGSITPRHETSTTAGARDEETSLPGPSAAPTSAGAVYRRYYHLFDRGELPRLARFAGLEVASEFYDKDNWCAELRKS